MWIGLLPCRSPTVLTPQRKLMCLTKVLRLNSMELTDIIQGSVSLAMFMLGPRKEQRALQCFTSEDQKIVNRTMTHLTWTNLVLPHTGVWIQDILKTTELCAWCLDSSLRRQFAMMLSETMKRTGMVKQLGMLLSCISKVMLIISNLLWKQLRISFKIM